MPLLLFAQNGSLELVRFGAIITNIWKLSELVLFGLSPNRANVLKACESQKTSPCPRYKNSSFAACFQLSSHTTFLQ